LANERGYSVLEVMATAERVTGKSIHVELVPRRPGDPAVLIGALEKARILLGWKPERSDLEVQNRDAWKWMMRQS